MYIRSHVSVWVHVRMRACLCMHMCTYVCVVMCVCMFVCFHVCVCVCVCEWVWSVKSGYTQSSSATSESFTSWNNTLNSDLMQWQRCQCNDCITHWQNANLLIRNTKWCQLADDVTERQWCQLADDVTERQWCQLATAISVTNDRISSWGNAASVKTDITASATQPHSQCQW